MKEHWETCGPWDAEALLALSGDDCARIIGQDNGIPEVAELMALFARTSGWWLALRGILFHQLYYLYSGAVYALTALRHRVGLPPG